MRFRDVLASDVNMETAAERRQPLAEGISPRNNSPKHGSPGGAAEWWIGSVAPPGLVAVAGPHRGLTPRPQTRDTRPESIPRERWTSTRTTTEPTGGDRARAPAMPASGRGWTPRERTSRFAVRRRPTGMTDADSPHPADWDAIRARLVAGRRRKIADVAAARAKLRME